ncbi:MAG: long-chain fatty acid--CoA ligase [Candidatus Eisenbacteria bacterium]|uniref:Long-chain fatty acid--CoA ligase n=1 Tax=Eiseniibacteriota bacterium TaxID=2212470 RepID=A0A849T0U9_UNCEI|nr:long-chain fatty acid--CoA ligase [Candidatus Eisenbacteria bacterium]
MTRSRGNGMTQAATLIGIFLDTIARHPKPDQFMRKGPEGWESLSSQRARTDVEHLSLGLGALGVQRGDRVALLSENRYEWAITDLAVLARGAVTVPIYPTLTAEQSRHVLANSEARLIVVSTAAQLEKIRSVAAQLPSLKTIVYMDPVPVRPEGSHGLAEVMEQGATAGRAAPGEFERLARSVTADEVATIIYTSGTTGEPKGAMLTHRNIASNVWAGLEVSPIYPTNRCLSFLPLCHIFERMGGFYSMLGGGASIAYAQSLDTVAADAMEVRPTVLVGVPRFFEKVYARVMDNSRTLPPLRRAIFHWGLEQRREAARAHFERRRLGPFAALQSRIADRLVGAKVRERVGGRVDYCVSGGAPLNAKVIEFFFAIGIPIREGYGLTETSPVITLNPPGREKPGSVGKAVPGVEVKIDTNGEILTRGPHVMKGYFRNEAATAVAITDGWFHTGDLGRFDDDGYLYITDRLKELLVTSGGKKVAPQPIEGALKTSKWITEAILIGDQRPTITCLLVPNFANLEGEARVRGWTFVRPAELLVRPEVRALYKAEVDRVNEPLAQFEKIKEFALLERELSQEGDELTPTLKVKRRVIAAKFAAVIDRLYANRSGPESH